MVSFDSNQNISKSYFDKMCAQMLKAFSGKIGLNIFMQIIFKKFNSTER